MIFGMVDDKTVVGLADIKCDIDIISKQIKEKITPLPTVDFRAFQTDAGKDILIVEAKKQILTKNDYISFGLCKPDGTMTNAGLMFSDECPLQEHQRADACV